MIEDCTSRSAFCAREIRRARQKKEQKNYAVARNRRFTLENDLTSDEATNSAELEVLHAIRSIIN